MIINFHICYTTLYTYSVSNLSINLIITKVCKLEVGSYSRDVDHMLFKTTIKNFNIDGRTVLDYKVTIKHLKDEDQVLFWTGTGSNFSLAGLEIKLERNILQYVIQYYIPSGLFVVVSWVSFAMGFISKYAKIHFCI